jgi:hypothetical protein
MREPTNEYLDLVNDLVPRAPAEGAYCIGMVSVWAMQAGYEPDRQLLEAARKCTAIGEANQVYNVWVDMQIGRALRRAPERAAVARAGLRGNV